MAGRCRSSSRGFNPRARVGRDYIAIINNHVSGVSIHAPAWGATAIHAYQPRALGRFNPRARVGRDGNGRNTLRTLNVFQSTRPRGARPPATPGASASSTSFNPRARVGRDDVTALVDDQQQAVSIHAPAWGATSINPASTHAAYGFNPRARVGRDRDADHRALERAVSIHAPAWGATELPVAKTRETKFQSTRPRGARHRRPKAGCRHGSFNPRARVGRDWSRGPRRQSEMVSIHAPAWGAT